MQRYTLSLAMLGAWLLAAPVHAVALTNPLATTDPNVIIGNIIKGLMGVLGTVALLLFIYGGVLMMLSVGDSAKVKRGRDTMLWAAIGIAIIFASYSLAQYALELVVSSGGAATQ